MPDPGRADRIEAARRTLDGTGRQPLADLDRYILEHHHQYLARALRDMARLADLPAGDDAWTVLAIAAFRDPARQSRAWLEDGHTAMRKTLSRLLAEVPS